MKACTRQRFCRLLPLMACLITSLSLNAAPARLPVIGHLYPIAEADFLETLQKRLKDFVDSGRWETLKTEMLDKTRDKLSNPQPLPGITVASRNRSFLYDPTIEVTDPIRDHEGRILHMPGTRVNPLQFMPLTTPMLFIDGREPKQVAWGKAQLAQDDNAILILTAGKYFDLMKEMDQHIYYDQLGALTTQFGITAVPARVEQEGDQLRVNELAL